MSDESTSRSTPPGRAAALPFDGLLLFAVLGLAGTAFAYLLFFALISSAGAGYASLVTYLVPPIALAYGAIFLGEHFGADAFVALAVILLGVALGTGGLSFARVRRRR